MSEGWDVGDRPRLRLQVTASGAAVDPTGVHLKVKLPSTGVVTTYDYPPAGTIVKDATGDYHADLTLSEAGVWQFRWTVDGSYVGEEPGELHVRPANL